MKFTSTPFSDLSFSKLFKDYIYNYQELSSFFDGDPFSESEIEKKIQSFSFKGDRSLLIQILKDYNRNFSTNNSVLSSIERLEDDKCLTVVTGQQLTLYGGPLFTIYKILTTIAFTKRLEKKYNRPFVTVFWMADEDHDYREAATLCLPEGNDIRKLFLEHGHTNEPRVSEIQLGNHFSTFRDEVKQILFETDFSNNLWKRLDAAYSSEKTFSGAFGTWLLDLFGEQGLILIGSNIDQVKKTVINPLIQSVEKADEVFEALNNQTNQLLKAGYHSQVHLGQSNLFWIDHEDNRVKISRKHDEWFIDGTDISWSSAELVEDIQENPNRFSPNVFLRPLTQNYLIPAVAYVAGPSEVAYYAQMKSFFEVFDLKMPIILPRFSITLVESGIDRILDKLPFKKDKYNQRIEDLESEYIDQADTPDIEALFGEWKKASENCSKASIKEVAKIDSTLENSAEKVLTTYFNELEKLKGKVYRSVKEQEKTQLQRIRRIQENLFPAGNLQEREVAFIYFMNKYGPDIWDRIYDMLKDQQPDAHKWIHL